MRLGILLFILQSVLLCGEAVSGEAFRSDSSGNGRVAVTSLSTKDGEPAGAVANTCMQEDDSDFAPPSSDVNRFCPLKSSWSAAEHPAVAKCFRSTNAIRGPPRH